MAAAATFSARSAASSASRPAVLPLLRDVRYFNEHQFPVSAFDPAKLGFSAPPKDASGKVTFYRDGMDNIVVPFTYDGKMAMNYGWIVRSGKFDFLKSKAKDSKADAYQLQANFPVAAMGDPFDAADSRKASMNELLRMLYIVEGKVRDWILADAEGELFGVPYTKADLDPKVRLDGKVEKGKFNTVIKSGTTPAGAPMLLKAYLKMPTDPADMKVYADLTLNGAKLESTVANFLDNVTWAKDVSILFSLKDIIRSTQGISIRLRVDAVGSYEAPKVFIPITNPFEGSAVYGGGGGAAAASSSASVLMEDDGDD
jgi:hypothetical protein